jgi:DNA-binding MarR family transcriptional regulator
MMNKNDIKILFTLAQNECISQLKSFTVPKIAKESGLSISKVRNTMHMLNALNYIVEGFPDGCSITYYITESGINYLKEVQK